MFPKNLPDQSEFEIQSIDPLGQGVSKKGDQVLFVPLTLPGETGICEIATRKKKIAFAAVPSQIKNPSQLRIEAPCPYYSDCGGCHFQHTTYENEVVIKQKTFKFLFKNFPIKKTNFLAAPQRFAYRNRIQLHYDISSKNLGFRSRNNQKIIPINNCLLAQPDIQKKLTELVGEQWWSSLPKNSPNSGLLEIAIIDNEVQLFWNQGHAASGFSQVYEQMNQQMLHQLSDWLTNGSYSKVIDLFGGGGNLSQSLCQSECFVIDGFAPLKPLASHQSFIQQNLYAKDALKKISKKIISPVDLMIVDPPRSGLKGLQEWVHSFRPKQLIYISCDPQTLRRDMQSLQNNSLGQWEEAEIIGLDFFPATYHFETMLKLPL